jgi:hypothetical protein
MSRTVRLSSKIGADILRWMQVPNGYEFELLVGVSNPYAQYEGSIDFGGIAAVEMMLVVDVELLAGVRTDRGQGCCRATTGAARCEGQVEVAAFGCEVTSRQLVQGCSVWPCAR